MPAGLGRYWPVQSCWPVWRCWPLPCSASQRWTPRAQGSGNPAASVRGECSSAEWSRVEESSARQSPAGQTGVGSAAVQQEESASEQFQLEQFEIESGSDGEQMQLPAKLIASWIGDGARQRGADVEAPRVGDLSGEATRLDELRSNGLGKYLAGSCGAGAG